MWFDAIQEWLQRRRVMREMRASERRDERDFISDFNQIMEDAENAIKVGERDRAGQLWHQARLRFPNLTLASDLGLRILITLNRLDEAEALMLHGSQRFPRTPFYFAGYAQIPEHRRNFAEAVARAAQLQKKFPSDPIGYSIAANSLRALGRYDEAKSVLRRGLGFAPSNIHLWLDSGQLAIDTQNWQEGLTIYTKAKAMFQHIAGPLGIARCLKELGRYDEAEAELREIHTSFPMEIQPWMELASIAEIRENWDEADRRWAEVRKRFSMSSVGFIQGRRALREVGREAEIEPLLSEAVDRIDTDAELLSVYARIAHDRGDWAAAEPRWALMRERFPDVREGWERGAEAVSALGRDADAAQLRVGG